MLVGAEHCDECGEVVGTVIGIEREPELMIVTSSNSLYLGDLSLSYGWYFRLPGSDAYGEHAIAELARARAEQAEKQQPLVWVLNMKAGDCVLRYDMRRHQNKKR